MNGHFNTHRIWFRLAATAVACLFLFNSVAFGFEPVTGQRSGRALLPTTRFGPLAECVIHGDGSIDLRDTAGKSVLDTAYRDDVWLFYVSRLIGKVISNYGSMISADGLKRIIGRDVQRAGPVSFDPERLYKEGKTFCLPYVDKKSGKGQVLRYYYSAGDKPEKSLYREFVPEAMIDELERKRDAWFEENTAEENLKGLILRTREYCDELGACHKHSIDLARRLFSSGVNAMVMFGADLGHFWVETEKYVLDSFPEGLGEGRVAIARGRGDKRFIIIDKRSAVVEKLYRGQVDEDFTKEAAEGAKDDERYYREDYNNTSRRLREKIILLETRQKGGAGSAELRQEIAGLSAKTAFLKKLLEEKAADKTYLNAREKYRDGDAPNKIIARNEASRPGAQEGIKGIDNTKPAEREDVKKRERYKSFFMASPVLRHCFCLLENIPWIGKSIARSRQILDLSLEYVEEPSRTAYIRIFTAFVVLEFLDNVIKILGYFAGSYFLATGGFEAGVLSFTLATFFGGITREISLVILKPFHRKTSFTALFLTAWIPFYIGFSVSVPCQIMYSTRMASSAAGKDNPPPGIFSTRWFRDLRDKMGGMGQVFTTSILVWKMMVRKIEKSLRYSSFTEKGRARLEGDAARIAHVILRYQDSHNEMSRFKIRSAGLRFGNPEKIMKERRPVLLLDTLEACRKLAREVIKSADNKEKIKDIYYFDYFRFLRRARSGSSLEDPAGMISPVEKLLREEEETAARALPPGSPYAMYLFLRGVRKFVTAGEVADRTGLSLAYTVKRDLGVLVFLGLAEKKGMGDDAAYRATGLSPPEWKIVEPILKSLGARPAAKEKKAAKESLAFPRIRVTQQSTEEKPLEIEVNFGNLKVDRDKITTAAEGPPKIADGKKYYQLQQEDGGHKTIWDYIAVDYPVMPAYFRWENNKLVLRVSVDYRAPYLALKATPGLPGADKKMRIPLSDDAVYRSDAYGYLINLINGGLIPAPLTFEQFMLMGRIMHIFGYDFKYITKGKEHLGEYLGVPRGKIGDISFERFRALVVFLLEKGLFVYPRLYTALADILLTKTGGNKEKACKLINSAFRDKKLARLAGKKKMASFCIRMWGLIGGATSEKRLKRIYTEGTTVPGVFGEMDQALEALKVAAEKGLDDLGARLFLSDETKLTADDIKRLNQALDGRIEVGSGKTAVSNRVIEPALLIAEQLINDGRLPAEISGEEVKAKRALNREKSRQKRSEWGYPDGDKWQNLGKAFTLKEDVITTRGHRYKVHFKDNGPGGENLIELVYGGAEAEDGKAGAEVLSAHLNRKVGWLKWKVDEEGRVKLIDVSVAPHFRPTGMKKSEWDMAKLDFHLSYALMNLFLKDVTANFHYELTDVYAGEEAMLEDKAHLAAAIRMLERFGFHREISTDGPDEEAGERLKKFIRNSKEIRIGYGAYLMSQPFLEITGKDGTAVKLLIVSDGEKTVTSEWKYKLLLKDGKNKKINIIRMIENGKIIASGIYSFDKRLLAGITSHLEKVPLRVRRVPPREKFSPVEREARAFMTEAEEYLGLLTRKIMEQGAGAGIERKKVKVGVKGGLAVKSSRHLAEIIKVFRESGGSVTIKRQGKEAKQALEGKIGITDILFFEADEGETLYLSVEGKNAAKIMELMERVILGDYREIKKSAVEHGCLPELEFIGTTTGGLKIIDAPIVKAVETPDYVTCRYGLRKPGISREQLKRDIDAQAADFEEAIEPMKGWRPADKELFGRFRQKVDILIRDGEWNAEWAVELAIKELNEDSRRVGTESLNLLKEKVLEALYKRNDIVPDKGLDARQKDILIKREEERFIRIVALQEVQLENIIEMVKDKDSRDVALVGLDAIRILKPKIIGQIRGEQKDEAKKAEHLVYLEIKKQLERLDRMERESEGLGDSAYGFFRNKIEKEIIPQYLRLIWRLRVKRSLFREDDSVEEMRVKAADEAARVKKTIEDFRDAVKNKSHLREFLDEVGKNVPRALEGYIERYEDGELPVLYYRDEEHVLEHNAPGEALIGRIGTMFAGELEKSGKIEEKTEVEEFYMDIIGRMMGNSLRESLARKEVVVCARKLDFKGYFDLLARYGKIDCIVVDEASIAEHWVLLAKQAGILIITHPRGGKCEKGEWFDLAVAGSTVVVDARNGRVVLNPDKDTLEKSRAEGARLETLYKYCLKNRSRPAETKDGVLVKFGINTSTLAEIEQGVSLGAEAVGLHRSEEEVMRMAELPDEDAQMEGHIRNADAIKGDYVVRTWDKAGDKAIPGYGRDRERGIRWYHKRPEEFKTQLRALIRAQWGSRSGNVKIMFPMLTSYADISFVLDTYKRVKTELSRGKTVKERHDFPRIGAMFEDRGMLDPACLRRLAGEFDFISWGTNDYIKSRFKISRFDVKEQYRFVDLQPRVLKDMREVLRTLRAKKPSDGGGCGYMGICGDLASMLRFLPFVISLQNSDIKVAPSVVPEFLPFLKEFCRHTSKTECEDLFRDIEARISDKKYSHELNKRVDDFVKEVMGRIEKSSEHIPAGGRKDRDASVIIERLKTLGARGIISAIKRAPGKYSFILDDPFLNDDSFWDDRAGVKRIIDSKTGLKDLFGISNEYNLSEYFFKLKETIPHILSLSTRLLHDEKFSKAKFVCLGRGAEMFYYAMRHLLGEEGRDRVQLLDFSRWGPDCLEVAGENKKAFEDYLVKSLGLSLEDKVVIVDEFSSTESFPLFVKELFESIGFKKAYGIDVAHQICGKPSDDADEPFSKEYHAMNWLADSYNSGRSFRVMIKDGKWEYVYDHDISSCLQFCITQNGKYLGVVE
ncbi:MAG: hypothetical protein KKG95_02090 [Candidatus Omnitrophica bacterium]|nr:hypothetical protein [Candidatus Omnitrophota bacterium]